MGNRRNNRFKRQEKSKVKLKGKKLSKAQNVTDTSFKVRKIVLPKQLKTIDDTEVVTRKKQNVKELLSRLSHHNESMKKNSLEGLKELLMYFPEEVLSLHLSGLIEGVAQLILDEERAIRRDAIKILGLILGQVPESKIQPFFNILMSYLSCGMTHIHWSVQDDSLMMLDTLVASAPSLVAGCSNKILTNILNMISSQRADSRPDRTLTVNLGTKFTAVRWRIKVLHSLADLLSPMLEHKNKPSTAVMDTVASCACINGNETHQWNNDKELNIPIHTQHYRQTCHLPGIFGNSLQGDNSYDDGNHLKNYMKVIIPLLIETWLEFRPDSNDYNVGDGSLLSQDAALVLGCVLKVICLLFELLQLWNLETEVPEVIAIYKKDFLQHFFPTFPYSCVDNEWGKQEKKRKSKIWKEDYMAMDKSCQNQNVAICLLFCRFYDEHAEIENSIRVLRYLEKSMRKWKKQNNKKDLIVILRHMIEKSSGSLKQQGVDIGSLLDSAIVCYMTTRDVFILELLSEIALVDICSHLQRNNNLQRWLECLPNLLCSSSISINEVRILRKLACQNNPFFYASLCQKLPDILNNLGSISVTGARDCNDGRKEIVNILYWIKDWSENAMKMLSKHLQCEHWDKDLAVEILNILTLRNLVNGNLKEYVGSTRV